MSTHVFPPFFSVPLSPASQAICLSYLCISHFLLSSLFPSLGPFEQEGEYLSLSLSSPLSLSPHLPLSLFEQEREYLYLSLLNSLSLSLSISLHLSLSLHLIS